MATDILKNIVIEGISCCVPENIMTSDSLSAVLRSDEIKKVKEHIGVKCRHISTKDKIITASDLCCVSAEKLLTSLKIDRQEIDAIICVTQSGDYPLPATACVLQYRLGLSEDAIAYDVHLDGSGYIYGLHIAATYLQSGNIKRVLLLTGESEAHKYPGRLPLDGAAGSATLIVRDEDKGYDMGFLLKSVGDAFRNIIDPYNNFRNSENPMISQGVDLEDCFSLQIKHDEVESFGISEASEMFSRYLSEFPLEKDDFDLFVFSQQSKYVIEKIKEKCDLPEEKCPLSMDIYGDTGSAAVPLAICDYFERLHPECRNEDINNVFLCGYGSGMSIGATSFSIKGTLCLPIVTLDEPWDDEMF